MFEVEEERVVNEKNKSGFPIKSIEYMFNYLNLKKRDIDKIAISSNYISPAFTTGNYFKKQNIRSWTLIIVSLIFFTLTLKSQRNVEYFIPFSLLFSSLVISDLLSQESIRSYQKKIEGLLPQRRIMLIVLTSLALIYIPIVLSSNLKGLRDSLSKNYNFNQSIG